MFGALFIGSRTIDKKCMLTYVSLRIHSFMTWNPDAPLSILSFQLLLEVYSRDFNILSVYSIIYLHGKMEHWAYKTHANHTYVIPHEKRPTIGPSAPFYLQ